MHRQTGKVFFSPSMLALAIHRFIKIARLMESIIVHRKKINCLTDS
jgi:hypothetical protein